VQSLLFGDILGVSGGDVIAAAGLTLVVLAALRLMHTRLLVVALLIAPAAAARALTHRMLPMMTLAAVIAIISGVAGLYVSYHLRTAAGASIALAMVASYALAAATTRLVPGRAS
jgi:ABC-type Mn2+/Zn2+ transport system permease subunit